MMARPARFMQIALLFTLIVALAPLHAEPPPPIGKAVPLFNGQTLDGWEGDPKIWRVEDGCLTGGRLTETVAHNDFLASTREFVGERGRCLMALN